MKRITSLIIVGIVALAPAPANADVARNTTLPPGLKARVQESIENGLEYLIASQHDEGAWLARDKPHPAVTALVVKALAQSDKYGSDHPATRRGLEFVLRYAQPDGGIYVPDEGHNNYHTSVALMALASIKDERLQKRVEGAQNYLKKLQWDGGEGHETSSVFYGGAGYGHSKRPDLSNTQLMLEALHESGVPKDDPVYEKAMVFISRCQMLKAANDQDFASAGGDGGFIYSPANGGESKAGTEIVNGNPRLRSYGSMTYSGFKSMLYAGLSEDDPRVKAAVDWISNYYTLEHNPNMPGAQSKEGLYYYYHVFARALDAWGRERIQDGKGRPHAWREELCEKLLALQRKDGSWVNEQDRWFEGNPHLVTAYCLLALQTALSH